VVETVQADWTGLLGMFGNQADATEIPVPAGNSQTIGLQSIAAIGSLFTSTTGGALLSDAGPTGTLVDVEEATTDQISLYEVRPGDTLSEIAEMYGVSVNTIAWANDMTIRTALKVGQVLIILPVSGVRHTVIKGDTIQSIAKKYQGDAEEIAQFNDLTGASLAVGQIIIIPNGEVAPAPTRSSSGAVVVRGSGPAYVGYYLRPVVGGRKTQGLHGYNGVDLAAPIGTPLLASAAGRVIISKAGGWYGGYGNYLVIEHSNKTQTLYAHLSKNLVSVGQTVDQGQVIGLMGSTGNSTGSHVHFEIRGARNPF
jgi:LysM repeat protein